MAKTKKQFIAASAFTSLIGTILGILALSTDQWVTSDASIILTTPITQPSSVSYGLFKGVFTQVLGLSTDISITMTCRFSSNICALLPSTLSLQDRNDALELLYAVFPSTYINAGLYISTVIFLSISILFGLAGTALSVWNFIDNPIEVWFNVLGIYICNSIACGSALMSLILWGAQFGATLTRNVCFYYSIQGVVSTEGLASLGYSYWLVFVTIFLYAGSIVLLRVRQYLIDLQPQIVIHPSDRQNIANTIIF